MCGLDQVSVHPRFDLSRGCTPDTRRRLDQQDREPGVP